MRRKRWLVPLSLICALFISAFGISCAEEESSDDGGDKKEQSDKSGGGGGGGADDGPCGQGDPEKPNNASDDCTPHVGPNAKVTVDGVVYRITGLEQTTAIGDAQFGTQEKASGVYLVLSISAHSTKGETVQLSDDTFKVTYEDGPEYSTDSDGTIAVTLAGDGGGDPFFLTDIQPDSTEKGRVVFDVPKKVLSKKPELRINELGFGEGHGFIQLPL